MKIKARAGVAGYHQGWLFKADAFGNEIPGTRREAWPYQKNLVLDTGLDYIGDSNNYASVCKIGSGTSEPAPEDANLDQWVANANSDFGHARGNNSAELYAWSRRTFRFNAGVATGNLNELGFAPDTSADLFSRSLIKDSSGNPITITKEPDEILDVMYELRWYAPQTDATGTCMIGDDEHDFIIRPSNVGATAAGSSGTSPTGWGGAGALGWTQYGMQTVRGATAFAGDIGTPLQRPASFISSGNSRDRLSAQPYVANSYKREYRMSFGVDHGNDPAGIRSLEYAAGPASFQMQLDPPAMKTSDYTFRFDVEISWGRA